MEATDEEDTLTIEQFKQRLSDLLPAAMGFLMKWAHIYAPGTGHDPEEMLHNSIVKFLTGERHAPTTCSLTTTLKNAMKSMAENDRRKHAKETSWLSNDHMHDGDSGLDPVENAPSGAPPIEGQIEGQQLIQVISNHLANDDVVMQVLTSRFQGLSKNEACEQMNMRRKDYDAAVKRMRRTVDKHYGR